MPYMKDTSVKIPTYSYESSTVIAKGGETKCYGASMVMSAVEMPEHRSCHPCAQTMFNLAA